MPFGPKVLKAITGINTGDLVPVPEFDGYYVTANGRVFCLRELSQTKWNDGYIRVSLGGKAAWKNKSGRHGAGVHRLIALAMLPRSPDETVVRHLDGNRTNNVLENLAWGTPEDNSQDMVRHGRSNRGSKNNTTVLSESQVIEIVKRNRAGESGPKLAKEFGVHRHTVYALLNNINWSWLTQEHAELKNTQRTQTIEEADLW